MGRGWTALSRGKCTQVPVQIHSHRRIHYTQLVSVLLYATTAAPSSLVIRLKFQKLFYFLLVTNVGRLF